MSLVRNEEQRRLQETAEDFLRRNAPVSALRKLRDEGDALGYSRELWQEMAELGWAGIILPQQYGGLEFGFAGMGALLQASGHTLIASPLLATAVIGASTILLGGGEVQKDANRLEQCQLMITMKFLILTSLPLYILAYHCLISVLTNSTCKITITSEFTSPEHFLHIRTTEKYLPCRQTLDHLHDLFNSQQAAGNITPRD